ncbi:MAG: AtpZ/AtpI family protein [Candidatus Hydrogenedentota bacterium]
MHRHNPEEQEREREARFGAAVSKKAERKIRGRQERERAIWSWLGMMGLVGWSVSIPTLAGLALGVWLDKRLPGETISWTLTFLIIGVALGCLQAWYWVQRESRDE